MTGKYGAGQLRRRDRVARSTGTNVVVEDTHHPDSSLDQAGGRWATVCEPHSWVINHPRLVDALGFAAHPEEWCDRCNGQEPEEDCPPHDRKDQHHGPATP